MTDSSDNRKAAAWRRWATLPPGSAAEQRALDEAMAMENAETTDKPLKMALESLRAMREERDALKAECERLKGEVAIMQSGWANEVNALRDENERLRDVSIGVAASLAAAISLLERSPKTAAPSNKMFDQMLADYRTALARFRAALEKP